MIITEHARVRAGQHPRAHPGGAGGAGAGKDGRGPKKPETSAKVAMARALYAEKNHTVAEICKSVGVSRATHYLYPREQAAAQP